MEVMIPPTSRDFDFGSGRSTPCGPSTPKRFGEYYFSAPTSPSRMADLYGYIDVELSSSTTGNHHGGSRPKASGEVENEEGEEEDFAFDFYKGSDSTSLSAEELFDGGKIRPLKPPPPPPQTELAGKSPARSPRSPVRQGKRTDKEDDGGKNKQEQERGRGRAPAGSGGPRAARSLSPYRVSSYPWEEDEKEKWQQQLHPKPKSSHQQGSLPRLPPAAGSSKGDSGSTSKKWKLKDFFLFRSASEGRATDKDPFGKFAGVFKKQEEMKNSNFGWGAADSPVAGSTSRRRRRPGPVSAHELHYTVNKAVSEELKKRTFLPYKQGILGRLAFNPAVHALANGFGSLYR